MYIAPNTTIRFLKNVRLEPDYVNTIYFSSKTAQANYFMNKTKYTLTAQSYQRVNRGICRVNYKAEDLYDCNYMMFQNTSFGSKWFYAFITKIEYVNNVTADVYYEIDSMQSWLKDITFSMCFVEREHSGSDNIGDNIVPEPIDTGEMVFNDYGKLWDDLDDMAIAVLTVDIEGGSQGQLIDGVYSGAKCKAYGTTQTAIANLNSYLNSFNQKPDAIIAMYMIPAKSLGNHSQAELDNGITTLFSIECEDYEESATSLNSNMTIDGHVVRNKKLFTYPYNYCHVDNANGRQLALRYEFFTDNNGTKNYTPQFKIHANLCMPITVVARPMNYKGVNGDNFINTESIDLTGYPMCSWNTDSWKAWVAQDAIPEAISAYMGLLNIGGSAGNAIMGAQSGLASNARTHEIQSGVSGATAGVGLVGNILKDVYKASIKADICRGSLNNANINVASHLQNFFVGRVSVNRQVAKIIDDFFDRFGYATHELKVPNITSRRSWNYVKTIGSNVDGNIPGDDKRIIDACFDRGITFWHNGDNVDNYSLNNDPVAP